MKTDDFELLKLINLDDPHEIVEEAKGILTPMLPDFNVKQLDRVFEDVIRLFHGDYPGYRACNTQYHDLDHTSNTFLAMARLIHGALLRGKSFEANNVVMGLIGTLLHDAGYIQTEDDDTGTGAKYTATHIDRSIEFMRRYFTKNNFSMADFKNCADMLNCTGLNTNIKKIRFKAKEIEMLGKMLGSADLLSQMADRVYLEKLLFLYYEFDEGNIDGYSSELDLLKKTIGFYDFTMERLTGELGGVNEYAIYHFRERWDLDRDLYMESIEKNKKYLEFILSENEHDYRNFLKRKGIVAKLDSDT